jgi:hypothetical protein
VGAAADVAARVVIVATADVAAEVPPDVGAEVGADVGAEVAVCAVAGEWAPLPEVVDVHAVRPITASRAATSAARTTRGAGMSVIMAAPSLDPAALGFEVTAFATLEIRQGRGEAVLEHLRAIPEVLEVHTITGPGDMLARLVARSNDDLQDVLNRVTTCAEIVRTSSVIALSNPIAHRVLPLLSQ